MKQETEWIEWFCFFLRIPSYSGWSRGGTRGGRPPLLLDQTKAQRVEKKIFKTALPPYFSGAGWLPFPPPPAPYLKVWTRHCPGQSWILDSTPDSVFQVLDSSLCQGNLDSGFRELYWYSGFQSPGFQIPRFSHISDSTSKNFLDSGIRIPLHGAK